MIHLDQSRWIQAQFPQSHQRVLTLGALVGRRTNACKFVLVGILPIAIRASAVLKGELLFGFEYRIILLLDFLFLIMIASKILQNVVGYFELHVIECKQCQMRSITGYFLYTPKINTMKSALSALYM